MGRRRLNQENRSSLPEVYSQRPLLWDFVSHVFVVCPSNHKQEKNSPATRSRAMGHDKLKQGSTAFLNVASCVVGGCAERSLWRMVEYVTIVCDVCFLMCVFCFGVASYDLFHTSCVLVSIPNQTGITIHSVPALRPTFCASKWNTTLLIGSIRQKPVI